MNRPPAKRLASIAVLVIAGCLVLVSAAVGVTAATMPGCESCHAREAGVVQGLQAGSHTGAECVSCHVPSGVAERVTFGTRVVFGMTLRLGQDGERASAGVPDATCLSCHGDVMERHTASRGYFIDHATCTEGARCTDCHSATAHGDATGWKRTAEMGQCLGCHSVREAAASCDTCHDPHTKSERLAVGGPWTVTHGSQWETTHGMGDLGTCSACHDRDYCVDCHGVSLPHGDRYTQNAHSTEALTSPRSCSGCHERDFCDSCHGVEMPHPAEFVQGHSATVEAGGTDACVRCHATADCQTCHVKHVHPVTLEQMDGALR